MLARTLPVVRGPCRSAEETSRVSRRLLRVATCGLLVIVFAGCSRQRQSDVPAKPRLTTAAAGENNAADAFNTPSVPFQVASRGFVSSKSCQACHREQYDSWHKTYHRTMTQLASAQTVVAPFDGRVLHRAGIDYRVTRRGDQFWVTTPDPDREYALVRHGEPKSMPALPMVERQVVMTTGSHHLQMYWLPSPSGNELRLFPWVYSIDEQRWLPYEDSFVLPPTSGRMRVCWNNSCIACHSVRGSPNFDREMDAFMTEVAEFGIACEACHGPGEPHIAFHKSSGPKLSKDPIVNPHKVSPQTSAQICGQCHSSFTFDDDYFFTGPKYKAGEDLAASHHLIDFEERANLSHHFHDTFWEDGTARIGGREYLGLRASKCFEGGELSCLNCHSMHSADPNQQLKDTARDNRVCLTCHEEIGKQLEQHTHHAPDSAGSQCYNCHMPRTSYALFRAMRSHRIDSPNVETSVKTGRPNACNLCHLDQTSQWTSRHLTEWFGTAPVDLDDDHTNISAAVLWLLRGDAAQRVITAWHMGWPDAKRASGDDWQAPILAQLLDDSYSAIRLVASRSLKSFPGFEDLDYDFLWDRQSLSQARQSAIDRWTEQRGEPKRDAAVLQDSAGTLDQATIKRLRRQQDDRPVVLAE